jgi:hypothetical protein
VKSPKKSPSLLDSILARIPFTEETISQACLNQSPLHTDAARYRTTAMRRRNEADASLIKMKAQTAIDLRIQFEGEGRKMTEAKLKEVLDLEPAIVEARLQLAHAEENEEWAKQLLEVMKGRREMVRVLASMIPGESPMTIGRRV